MGCYRSGYPSGLVGPVREPAPGKPVVVGIGHDRQIPSAQGIYAGESAQFVIVFSPEDYVSQISDFSCDTEGVLLALVPEQENVLSVTLVEDITPGTVATIKFKDQAIIKVAAAANLKVVSVWDDDELPVVWEEIEDGAWCIVKFNELPVGVSLDDFSLQNESADQPFSLTKWNGGDLSLHVHRVPYKRGTADVYFRNQHILTLSE